MLSYVTFTGDRQDFTPSCRLVTLAYAPSFSELTSKPLWFMGRFGNGQFLGEEREVRMVLSFRT